MEDMKQMVSDLKKTSKKYEKFIKATCKLHQYQDLFESKKIFNQGKLAKIIESKVKNAKKDENPFEIVNVEIN